MAYNSAQIEKDKRGFKSPISETPAEVVGQLRKDIWEAQDRLKLLTDIAYEVEKSLWSELGRFN